MRALVYIAAAVAGIIAGLLLVRAIDNWMAPRPTPQPTITESPKETLPHERPANGQPKPAAPHPQHNH